MTSNESLFGLARQFQFAVGASQDLDVIVQIFRTVLHSANTLPVPPETKKGRPHKLTKAEKKKLQDEAEPLKTSLCAVWFVDRGLMWDNFESEHKASNFESVRSEGVRKNYNLIAFWRSILNSRAS